MAALIYNRGAGLGPPAEPDGTWFVGVMLPAAGLYFLYHFVLEIALRGRTPGKRMAGVRVVARDGSTPTAGALLTRNVFRLIDGFPSFYSVGLVATMITRDHVRIGDLAAGTLLAYDRAVIPLLEHVESAMTGGSLDAASAEIVNELLGRWSRLDREARRRLGRQVLALRGVQELPEDDEELRRRLERLARGEPP